MDSDAALLASPKWASRQSIYCHCSLGPRSAGHFVCRLLCRSANSLVEVEAMIEAESKSTPAATATATATTTTIIMTMASNDGHWLRQRKWPALGPWHDIIVLSLCCVDDQFRCYLYYIGGASSISLYRIAIFISSTWEETLNWDINFLLTTWLTGWPINLLPSYRLHQPQEQESMLSTFVWARLDHFEKLISDTHTHTLTRNCWLDCCSFIG